MDSCVYIPLFSHEQRRVRYTILRIESRNLQRQQYEPPPLMISAELKDDVDLFPLMGCGTLQSKILLVGGQEAQFKCLHMNTCVIAFDTIESGSGRMRADTSSIPRMNAGKGDALIAEMDGKVYVLNGSKFFGGIDPPFFEVYNPSNGLWSALPSPPFTSRKVAGYLPHHLSSILFDKKMFVSAPGMKPVYFETRSGTWRTDCNLFQGQAFPFRKKGAACFHDTALSSNDFALICFTQAGHLVAYRVSLPSMSCKAKETQLLCKSETIVPPSFTRRLFSGCFAHLGGGIFCLASTIDDEHEQMRDGDVALCLTTFQVSRVPHQQNVAFLEFKMLSHYRYSVNQLSSQIGKIIGCFAL